ncbi:MAG TPA: efflux RND transporter periplasmic adaptor subunit [Geothermobacteraceae bacterium]|nr:efflux RND transporter periplasmic adaptor subunit [Geothermobacteraceae bacterium]
MFWTITLTLTLLFTGFGWYAGQCLVRMAFDSPLEVFMVHAAETKYTCGMHPMIIVDEPGSCPICGMDLVPLKAGVGAGAAAKPAGERKIKYWQAPMDPTYIRDEPGKSPMGMDLIPVYEDEAASGSTISIDPVTAQNMGVRTAPVTRMNLARTVRTVGLVAYPEPLQYAINTKIGGWIEKLYVNETGQQVKKGQKLLEIYSPELVSAQEEYLLALKNSNTLVKSPFPQIAESGRQLLEASKRRLQLWDISDAQIARLEKDRRVEKTMALFAPHNGIVSMKMVQEGQFAKPGMDLLTISDISKVWVQADIYEYELPWIKIGQQAEIVLPFVGSKTVSGTLSYLYPYVEPKTRTVKARFELANPDIELKPDMYVNVHLQTSPVENALAVPAEAVLHSGEKKTIFVALGEGKFEPRQVKTGVQDDDGNLEIVQGLMDGERVVTSAQFMLDSESKLREAIAKMLEPKSAPAAAEKPGGAMKMDDLFADDKAKSEEKLEEKLDDLFK